MLNILGWLLSIATLVGNSFVVLLIAKNQRLHSSANWLVFSLAVADFGVGITVYPSSYFCNFSSACNLRVYVAFFWFFLHSSVTNLCTLTWDRYIAIVHPFKYIHSMTERRPGVVILVAWLIPFAISLLLLVGMYATKSHTVLKVLRITGASAFHIISCALLFYGVIRILVVARAQSRQLSAMELQVQRSSNLCNQSTNLHATSGRRKKHNTASFVIALVVFFLRCYVVVNYLVLCMAFSCHQVSDDIAQVVICLLLVNSAVNPLVYALLKNDIKIELRKLICRSNNHRGGSLMRALKSSPFSFFYWHGSTYMPIAFVVFFTYFTPKVLSDLPSR